MQQVIRAQYQIAEQEKMQRFEVEKEKEIFV